LNDCSFEGAKPSQAWTDKSFLEVFLEVPTQTLTLVGRR